MGLGAVSLRLLGEGAGLVGWELRLAWGHCFCQVGAAAFQWRPGKWVGDGQIVAELAEEGVVAVVVVLVVGLVCQRRLAGGDRVQLLGGGMLG